MASPSAAMWIGRAGAGGTLSLRARAWVVTARGMRSPRSSVRTCVTICRIRGTGGANGVSCRPSASCGVLAPRPSTKRPPEIAWSVVAAIAMVAALRLTDTEDPGSERDPPRARGRLGEEHGHVVPPCFWHEEAVVAEAIA